MGRYTIPLRVRTEVGDRCNGTCERIVDGKRCNRPAAEIHHKVNKSSGGRKGEAKKQIEHIENYEARCQLCHHTIVLDGRRYHGHQVDKL